MDELKTLETALFKAYEKGDVAAAKLIASDMQRMMQLVNPSLGMPEKVKLGREGLPGNIRDAAKTSTELEQVLAGAGSAPLLALEGLKGLAGKSNPDTVSEQKAIRGATPYTSGGNIAGNVGMFGALPTRAGAGAVTLGAAALGRKAPGMVASRPWMVGDTVLTSGGLNAATEPGDVGDRLSAGVLSAVASGAAPALYATGAGARRALTRGGKRVSVGEGILAEIGDEGADRTIGLLANPDRASGVLGVRSSSAMRSGNPAVEALESGSRVARGDLWRQFDAENASARWNSLTSKAGTPEELAALRGARESATGAIRNEAMQNANISAVMTKGGSVSDEMLAPITSKINDFRTGAARPNKDVQVLADYVESQLKQGVTPEQLYEIRKFLTDGVKAGRNDELSNAVKSARAQRMEIVGMLDETLNTLSGGYWKDYLKKYSGMSLPITSKQALQDMVSSLQHGQPLGTVPSSMGAAWKTVGNLRDRFGQKEVGGKVFDRLTPDDRDLVNTLVDNLKKQSDVMSTKAILGSPTAALLANAGRAQSITNGVLQVGANKAIPFGGILTANAFDRLGRKAEEELARVLQDPELLIEAIKGAQRAGVLNSAASRAGAASGGGFQGR